MLLPWSAKFPTADPEKQPQPMKSFDTETLRNLLEQIQAMQAQMAVMATQHATDNQNFRNEILRLQVENGSLRDQLVAQPMPPSAPRMTTET